MKLQIDKIWKRVNCKLAENEQIAKTSKWKSAEIAATKTEMWKSRAENTCRDF